LKPCVEVYSSLSKTPVVIDRVCKEIAYLTLLNEELTHVVQVLHLLMMCVGNDNLHLMTLQKYNRLHVDGRQRMRVDLADWEGYTAYAEYDNFRVESAEQKYKLITVGTYNGTAGQCMM